MIQIKINDFTLTYDGAHPEAGFVDLIEMSWHLFAVAGYWSFGKDDE